MSRAGPSARQPAARPVAARPIAARPIAAQTPSCKPTLAAHLDSTGKATEVLTVESSSYATTHATATLWQRQGPCWVSAGGPWPARIGFKGFSNHHVEGDGTTPTGSYSLGPVVYGNAPDPGTHYTYHRLACGDWWDEDPSSPAYNSFQHVGCGQAPPFGGGSEALWTETRAYPSFAVVDYNTHPVVRGAGSGIFVHADIGAPTDGCVSLPLANLDTALRRLRPADQPLVVMGPASEITRF
ncbi:MAG: L,D-transpeptidase family protein [Acidimicrobiales bacterium]